MYVDKTPFNYSSSTSDIIVLRKNNHKPFLKTLFIHLTTKSLVHNYLIKAILLIILILGITLISSIYTLIQIQSSITPLSSTLSQMKLNAITLQSNISTLNKKKMISSLSSASYLFSMRKTDNITAIITHEISHISHKKSSYYNQFRTVLSQSTLLRGIDDVNQLYLWFPSRRLNTEEIIMELIYRGSRDGDSKKSFHSKCDDQNSTITLIQTKPNKHNKKYLEGVFTTVPYSSNRDSLWVHSGLVYQFSLDNGFKLKNERIFNSDIRGFPWLLNIDNCIILKEEYLSLEKGVYLNTPHQLNVTNKEEPFKGFFFKVEDVEVFKVYVRRLNN